MAQAFLSALGDAMAETRAERLRHAVKCRHPACGAMLLFEPTPNGKRMPMDAETGEPHWKSCPGSAEFRKGREAPSAPKVDPLSPAALAEHIRVARLAKDSFFGTAYWLAVVTTWPAKWRDRYWRLVQESMKEGFDMTTSQRIAWCKACASLGVEP